MVPTKLTSRFRGSELAVLVAITSHAERSGYFEQSKSDLAINAGVTKSTVCEATKGLLRLKVIVCERKGTGHTRTLYRLNVPHVSECDQELGALSWRSASGHIFDSLDLLPARSVTPPEPSGPEGRPTTPSRSSDQRVSHEESGEQDFRGEPPRTSAVRQFGYPVSGRADPSGPAARTAPQSPRALGLLPNIKNNSSSQQSGIAAAEAARAVEKQPDEREQLVREMLGRQGIGGSKLHDLSRDENLTPDLLRHHLDRWRMDTTKRTGALIRNLEGALASAASFNARPAVGKSPSPSASTSGRMVAAEGNEPDPRLAGKSDAELVRLVEAALARSSAAERDHVDRLDWRRNPRGHARVRLLIVDQLNAIERSPMPAVSGVRAAVMG